MNCESASIISPCLNKLASFVQILHGWDGSRNFSRKLYGFQQGKTVVVNVSKVGEVYIKVYHQVELPRCKIRSIDVTNKDG